MGIKERLGKEWLFFDGGTGTLLQERGLAAGELPETWNLTRPEELVAVHRAYLEAGSDIICTNTFGANALKFPDDLPAIVQAGVENAKEARRQAGRPDAYIALDIGPTGRLLQPMGDLPFERAVELFGEVVRVGAAAGADLVLIETMSDSYEAKAAVLAAKENCTLPVMVTVIFDEKGKLLTGGTVDSVVALLEGLRVDALGVNCGLGPAQMLPIVERLAAVSSLPLIVDPNAGLPRSEDGRTVYDIDADTFATLMGTIAQKGVHVLGGCCGTTPAHIRKMVAVCRSLPFVPPVRKRRAVVSSFSQAVEIGDTPIIIGERINPTGKSKFKAALRENNMEYILAEGLAQEDNGAHILDVNVGLPGLDEPTMMAQVVTRLQSVLALPLQIDTSSPEAMERGLRLYNGKPMINSVNGKQENMKAVFPLVRKYGGVVVGLTLDEDGIPDDAEGRVRIARRIYETAATYGIPPEDVVIDGLAMTISSDSGSALVTLETLRRVRDELGGHTILGVSNISFGLPQRETINAHFFTMAMQNGLSCAIINPNADGMMRAYRAFLALSGKDAQCAGFIAAYGDRPAAPQTSAAESTVSLSECVERGLRERAVEAAKALLQDRPPLEVVDGSLIPALDRVGKDFEQGKVFLPQLLMSAEAAKAAFEVVKDAMRGTPREMRGKVILATVKGDIHDIGKNIVKVLLENYGYQVIDLGKDVPPETIAETAVREQVQLIGLSALMTTTVVSMEQTIRLLREVKPDAKIVVGGAVLTKDYAESIGADSYARDAMSTVHYADTVFG
ncbi:MAG: homocysteine S-methyltransferase family protein [Eubacteriales bacterium]|nr:homocysteine S-methyltransferase family protein [Eubacteriales bacterium]